MLLMTPQAQQYMTALFQIEHGWGQENLQTVRTLWNKWVMANIDERTKTQLVAKPEFQWVEEFCEEITGQEYEELEDLWRSNELDSRKANLVFLNPYLVHVDVNSEFLNLEKLILPIGLKIRNNILGSINIQKSIFSAFELGDAKEISSLMITKSVFGLALGSNEIKHLMNMSSGFSVQNSDVGKIGVMDSKFLETANFENLTIKEGILLSNSKFLGTLKFTTTRCASELTIKSQCEFSSHAYLNGMNVGGNVSIERSDFLGGLNFDNSEFASDFSIKDNCNFRIGASFSNLKVTGNLEMSELKFHETADFKTINCKASFLIKPTCNFKSTVNFLGLNIGENFECSDVNFCKPVSFEGISSQADFIIKPRCNFRSSVKFSNLNTIGKFECSNVVFHGEVEFSSLMSGKDFKISNVNFENPAIFSGMQSHSNFVFDSGCNFKSTVEFNELAVSGSFEFFDLVFFDRVSFISPKFFSNAEIGHGCKFKSNLHIEHLKSEGDFKFSGIVFSGEADFKDMKFRSNLAFESNCIFESATRFSDIEVTKQFKYSNSTFKNNLTFQNSKFYSSVVFDSDCNFQSTAKFLNIEVREDFECFALVFHDVLNFTDSNFHSNFIFGPGTNFKSNVYLSDLNIKQNFESKNSKFENFVYFHRSEVSGAVNFSDACFEKCPPDFHGSDLGTDIIFTLDDGCWPKSKNFKQGIESKIELLKYHLSYYGRLTEVMKEIGKKEDEHFFFRKESKTKLRLSWGLLSRELCDSSKEGPKRLLTWSFWKSLMRGFESCALNAVYWILSNYGHSVVRPLFWLLFSIFLFWLIFSYCHSWFNSSCSESMHPLRLSLANTFRFFGAYQILPQEDLRKLTDLGRFFSISQTFVSAIIFFFLALGLKTRFRLR